MNAEKPKEFTGKRETTYSLIGQSFRQIGFGNTAAIGLITLVTIIINIIIKIQVVLRLTMIGIDQLISCCQRHQIH